MKTPKLSLARTTGGPAAASTLRFPATLAQQQWSLDPGLTFLNHGSYGSVPKAALRAANGAVSAVSPPCSLNQVNKSSPAF